MTYICFFVTACVHSPPPKIIVSSPKKSNLLKERLNAAANRDEQLKIVMEYLSEHYEDIMKFVIKDMIEDINYEHNMKNKSNE